MPELLARNTHAATMHFAILLPDWNSLDSVRRAHCDLEAVALVFFALLVICEVFAHLSEDEKREKLFDKIGILFFGIAVLAEIVAYPYGQRNDALSEQIIGSLDAIARDASSKGSRALTDSGQAEALAQSASDTAGPAKTTADEAKSEAEAAALKASTVSKKADQIDAHLTVVEYTLSARFVQDEDGLRDELKKDFRESHVVFKSYFGDGEAFWLCNQLVQIADKAGVDPKSECAMQPLKDVPRSGLSISAPTIDEAHHLSMTLARNGRVPLPGHAVQLGIGPLTVFVGTNASVRLWWPKAEKQFPAKATNSNKSAKP